jgi:branched-chain amino acid transport system substrate-binding protein
LKKLLLFFFIAHTGFINLKAISILDIQLPDTIKIGFLIPDKTSKAALYGAEMAINKANKEGGFRGKPFKLVAKTLEGPWGTGSKQAVSLIFDEKVWAILGSHDGRNAHPVEQVSTKARIVFLSAWATDPTLSEAFVPCFFNCVPDDNQIADAIIEEIYNKKKLNNTAIISDNSYDSRSGVTCLGKKIRKSGKSDPYLIVYEDAGKDLNEIINKVDKKKPDCIIMFGKPGISAHILESISKEIKYVVGSPALLDENELSDYDLKNFENVNFILSGINRETATFRTEYQKIYGNPPGLVASYGYDGTNCLIRAIRIAGLDRIEIQKSLSKIRFEGVTGMIQFDDKGKRTGTPVFMKMRNRVLVPSDIK